jgi:hypothetical protein
MVALTTTGNSRDCFVKRPIQTSMYYHYGPWHCHVSAPHWGLLWIGRVQQKKIGHQDATSSKDELGSVDIAAQSLGAGQGSGKNCNQTHHCTSLHLSTDRKTSRAALQLLRSFLSPLFLLCSCFCGSQCVCVCVCACVCLCLPGRR